MGAYSLKMSATLGFLDRGVRVSCSHTQARTAAGFCVKLSFASLCVGLGDRGRCAPCAPRARLAVARQPR